MLHLSWEEAQAFLSDISKQLFKKEYYFCHKETCLESWSETPPLPGELWGLWGLWPAHQLGYSVEWVELSLWRASQTIVLIHLSWPLDNLSIRQNEKILTWGINFQKYLENKKLKSYFLRCLQSPKEAKMKNLTSFFSSSERKPMFWAFKSSSLLIWIVSLDFFLIFFICGSKGHQVTV